VQGYALRKCCSLGRVRVAKNRNVLVVKGPQEARARGKKLVAHCFQRVVKSHTLAGEEKARARLNSHNAVDFHQRE
jgi:hypothetical protein